MKREKFLWILTQDHREVLAEARRIRQKAEELRGNPGAALERELVRETREFFLRELEEHFRQEERMVNFLQVHLPSTDGEAEVVHSGILRLLREHDYLEAMAWSATAANLLLFAGSLERHIRFEEDELFQTLEKRLSAGEKGFWEDTLARWEAVREKRAGRCDPLGREQATPLVSTVGHRFEVKVPDLSGEATNRRERFS